MTADNKLTAERVQRLVTQFIDDDLSPNDVTEFHELVQSDASCLALVADQMLLDALLCEELGVESMTALVDLVADSENEDAANSETSHSVKSSISESGNLHRGAQLHRWRPTGWIIAAAILVLVALVAGRWENTALADASSLVRAAMVTHAEPIERVYVVEVQRPEVLIPDFAPPRDVHVMTQGDRFWVEMNRGEKRWMWGKAADDAMWLTLGPRRALRIERDEAGTALQNISEIYSLNLETLLDNVLQHCRVKPSADSGPTHVMTASPVRRWQGRLREMTIEVDRETKVIRRLVIRRNTPQQGESTVTFTLVDSRVPDETLYRPEGHLIKPYRILTSDTNSDKRREILTSWFGSTADRWIKSEE